MALGKSSGIKLLFGAAVMGLGTLAATPPARAQDSVTTSVAAVRECLCAQRQMSYLHRRVDDELPHYQDAQAHQDQLTQEVASGRARVNTDNRADIEAFTALLARRDEAVRTFRQVSNRYGALVARYNRAVAYSNEMCSNRLFDPREVEAVKVNLACPRL